MNFTNPSGSYQLSNATFATSQPSGSSIPQNLCAAGYSGHLCGVCMPGWGSTAVFQCRRCYPASVVIGLYSLICFAMLLVVRMMTYFAFMANNQPANAGTAVNMADICKSLVLWTQWLAVVASIRVDWPAALRAPFVVLQWLWASPASQTLSLDCALQLTSYRFPLAVQRLVVYLGVPVATYLVLIAAAALWRLLHKCRAIRVLKCRLVKPSTRLRRQQPHFGRVCVTYLLVTTFVFLPSLSRTVFSLFVCVQVDDAGFVPYAWTAKANGSFWASDMSQQCDARQHLALGLGIPCVLLLCFILPLSIVLLLWLNRSSLQDSRFKSMYGFLYNNYRPGWCAIAWEAVIVCQTNIIAAISVFGLSLGSLYQATVMSAFLATFLVLLLLVRPYHSPVLHTVRLVGMIALLFTSYTSITFATASGLSPQPPRAYSVTMSVVLLVTNAAYAGSCLVLLAKSISWHIIPKRCLKVCAWMKRVCGGNSSPTGKVLPQALAVPRKP